jgi:hypothetical protein
VPPESAATGAGAWGQCVQGTPQRRLGTAADQPRRTCGQAGGPGSRRTADTRVSQFANEQPVNVGADSDRSVRLIHHGELIDQQPAKRHSLVPAPSKVRRIHLFSVMPSPYGQAHRPDNANARPRAAQL